MYLMKNFQKGVGLGEVKLCGFGRGSRNLDGDQEKQKYFLRFLQKWLDFKTFLG